jgi:hypothetical protein
MTSRAIWFLLGLALRGVHLPLFLACLAGGLLAAFLEVPAHLVRLEQGRIDGREPAFLSGLASLIPATCGRPGADPLKGRYRRLMRRRLRHGPDTKLYGQRWPAETVNSMVKRNLGSACRARTPWGRRKDMLFRSITHNLMIVANL